MSSVTSAEKVVSEEENLNTFKDYEEKHISLE